MFDDLPEALLKVFDIRQKVAPLMLLRRNVVGVGVGYKIRGQEITDEPSVMISVTQKMDPQSLGPDDLVPSHLDGVSTDVIETGLIRAHTINRRTRQRPVRPGLSVGHADSSAGTLGAFVRKDDKVYLMSNNHVLANLNEAHIGDPILQPGPADGGTLFDQIAYLASFSRLRFLDEIGDEPEPKYDNPLQEMLSKLAQMFNRLRGGKASGSATGVLTQPYNTVDAALAQPVEGLALNPSIIDVEGPPTGIIAPALGMRVLKSGRTTGLTTAQIIQVDVTIDVQYDTRVARFTNQIMTSALSDQGDSGSLILDYKRRAVGLLFSGSTTVSVVHPIQSVLDTFGVELVTSETL